MKEFIKNKLQENTAIYLVESLIKDDYPKSFEMDTFKGLSKFTERVKYCDQHLKKIAAGSSRIVYMIDDTKVLKLAKNAKGVAQCETEIQWGNDSYFDHILAQTIDSHPKYLWVEMELARKVSNTQFKQEFGFTVEDFGRWLKNNEFKNKGQREPFQMNQDLVDIINESDFANDTYDFMVQADAPGGDFGRISTYGLVKRSDGDRIVIIDFGLTNSVYSTYYS